jgi:hypothetical protein
MGKEKFQIKLNLWFYITIICFMLKTKKIFIVFIHLQLK